ncbi:hypothetical protein DER44DRAFT_833349 [Fusarium oxysporum]|nr:hypothetical protein DER44DRAFT_833349 [Fusarium oxysporum]
MSVDPERMFSVTKLTCLRNWLRHQAITVGEVVSFVGWKGGRRKRTNNFIGASVSAGTIHLRDFINTITDDPSRESAPNYVEIQTEVNIFEESSFYSSSVNVEPIHRELYVPNAFFNADGRFAAALHPGDVSDFDEYPHHLPEQWCPMVTIIGFVPSRNDKTPDFPEARCFAVETSVYGT